MTSEAQQEAFEKKFQTHTGEIVTGEKLDAAYKSVADDWRKLAYAIRIEDAYGPHVLEQEKESDLQRMLVDATAIEQGLVGNFTIWQRVNEKLTGECVPFLPAMEKYHG